MKRALLILGHGGHGRAVADIALESGYDRIAFLDDSPAMSPDLSHPVLGPIAMIGEHPDGFDTAIVAIGNNRIRLELFLKLASAGYRTPALVHPRAIVSRSASVGAGVVIAPGAIVNTGTTIAEAAIINTGAIVDHDCIIGRSCHIAPGVTLSGNVAVGDCAWIGTGSSVRQNIRIGCDAVIGVGSAVVSDLAAEYTYAGVPARRLGLPITGE